MSNGRFTVTRDHLDNEVLSITWPTGADPVGRSTTGARRFYLDTDDGDRCYSGWLVEGDCLPAATYAVVRILGLDEDPIDVWDAAYGWGEAMAGTSCIKNGRNQGVIG